MLGFAFSEAARSQAIAAKLQQQRQQQPVADGRLTPPASAKSVIAIDRDRKFSPRPQIDIDPDSADVEQTELIDSAISPSGHKRTRRRRRQKRRPGPTASRSLDGPSSLQTDRSTLGPTPSLVPRPIAQQSIVSATHDAPMTRKDVYFVLRCCLVAVGPDGQDGALGRVLVINYDEQVVLDTFVQVPVPIYSVRTAITGIAHASELQGTTSAAAVPRDVVRQQVSRILQGKILIGHGLDVDLVALDLHHPTTDVRDVALYEPFMRRVPYHTFPENVPAAVTNDPVAPPPTMLLPVDLPFLMDSHLQHFEPDWRLAGPFGEALGCLLLYKNARTEWEQDLSFRLQEQSRQRKAILAMRSVSCQPRVNDETSNAVSWAPIDTAKSLPTMPIDAGLCQRFTDAVSVVSTEPPTLSTVDNATIVSRESRSAVSVGSSLQSYERRSTASGSAVRIRSRMENLHDIMSWRSRKVVLSRDVAVPRGSPTMESNATVNTWQLAAQLSDGIWLQPQQRLPNAGGNLESWPPSLTQSIKALGPALSDTAKGVDMLHRSRNAPLDVEPSMGLDRMKTSGVGGPITDEQIAMMHLPSELLSD